MGDSAIDSHAITITLSVSRAARAFGEYLSHSNPENRNGSDHLLSDTFIGQDSESPDARPQPQPSHSLSLEHSFSIEEPESKPEEGALQSPKVYTITGEGGMLGDRASQESLELEVLKVSQEPPVAQLPVSGSAHNIRDWGVRRGGSRDDCSPDCEACRGPPSHSHRSLDLETCPRETSKARKKLERMYSEDRMSGEDRDISSWFPKENMFSFQTATTTMQANFRKHLRMVGSRRMKAQTFADRRAKSFSRSWSDPTPVKPESLHDSRDSGDLQASSGALNEEVCEDLDWEEEREAEKLACQGDDFIPPKIMLISSKVPKAEYVPTIIRRDDPSIIPILYVKMSFFHLLAEEIEKKLTAYRRGCKIWRMLIFCQGGPGHLYLLKNKVATFAKVEKEEDMINFWKRLSRLMSKLNPEPNLIHIMGCYVLGNANGEKLFQNLKNLMKPYSIEFKSPLELSAQGKEMIEMYFDFRLFRLWKARQHSKLLDYDDLL
uniref:NMDA receptor synaptonuclear signaling and neuronal migration factor b n=1 Tax=Scleropages formosus TaxID=113540 RepID=A0A8C9S5J3_SCLFO